MQNDLIARATVTVDAPAERVWDALVNPDAIRQYMFGARVSSAWQTGSPITWQGEWQGKPYQDKGVILRMEPGRALQYSHFSPLSGMPDRPENYHVVTIELTPDGPHTQITLTQDHNANEEERADSVKNWSTMLAGLKQFVERAGAS